MIMSGKMYSATEVNRMLGEVEREKRELERTNKMLRGILVDALKGF